MKEKKGSNPIYYKSTSLKFDRPSTETRTVKGYFAAFNSVDSDMDVIRKGAFAKSINDRGPLSPSNRKVKYLHQHNPMEACGAIKELFEDDYGLGFEADIERTPLGDIVLERYSNGTYTEHSIGFKYIQDKCNWIDMSVEMVEDKTLLQNIISPTGSEQTLTVPVFECKELNLFEGSVVTWGANMNTPFVGFKGTKEDMIKQLNDELEYLIKRSPSYEYELQIRSLFSKQISFIESLAVKDIKEDAKPKSLNYDAIINQIKTNKLY